MDSRTTRRIPRTQRGGALPKSDSRCGTKDEGGRGQPPSHEDDPRGLAGHQWSHHCHVCEKPLEGDTVRDHCHITGKYRGAAYNVCNLKLRLSPKTTTIPVVFHNLRGYDSHLLMQAISTGRGQDLLHPQQHGEVHFFLSRAAPVHRQRPVLAGLPGQAGGRQPARGIPDYNPVRAMQRKAQSPAAQGHLPVRVYDSWERFAEPRLPPKEAFYSKLSGEHISEADYAHAQKVWGPLDATPWGDYHDLYNRTDVLLLADVFETFRKTGMRQYGLDPAHYYTSPAFMGRAAQKDGGGAQPAHGL